MSVTVTTDSRIEKRYRRLLALYPRDHRREHAEEMVGVLLAADGDTPVRAPNPVAWVVRSGQHAADMADLIDGALRIRGRMALNRIRRTRWLAWTVRDQRWSDALAVVSVIAPLLLLVAALTEFRIPQAVASSITGHPHWGATASLGLADLPMAAGAPGVALLVFLGLRRLAGLGALATAIGQIAAGAVPAFAGYADPAVAFTVLLSCTAAVALLFSPGPDRGLALLTRGGTALVGAGALILGGFSVGGDVWFGPMDDGAAPRFDDFGGKVAGLPADLLIAAVLITAAAACLRAPVSRRVLALLAIPVIPYAFLWQEKLAADLFVQPGGGTAVIPSSIPMLYLPPLLLASLILTGTWLARRRAGERDRQVGSATSGPRSAMSACPETWWWWRRPPPSLAPPPPHPLTGHAHFRASAFPGENGALPSPGTDTHARSGKYIPNGRWRVLRARKNPLGGPNACCPRHLLKAGADHA